MTKSFILVAEDDADDRFLMKTALRETGMGKEVAYVENGLELLDYLDAIVEEDGQMAYPKLVLLDLNMPKMDGREVLKKMKSNGAYKRIPVIVFSTTQNQPEVRTCYELGANSYVVKPVSYDTLVSTLKEICGYWFKTATLAESPQL